MVGLGVLRKAIDRNAVNGLWRSARDEGGRPSRPCPVCAGAMSEVTSPGEAPPVDVCVRCHMMWFDGGEWDAMPAISPPPSEAPVLSEEARARWAFYKMEQIRREAEFEDGMRGGPPDAWWKWIPALFSLPVEMRTPSLARLPLVTWGFAGVCLLIFFLVGADIGSAASRWGFVPGEAWRWGGMTPLSSLFLHAGWWHLLPNLYFLLVFGDDVEDFLGHARAAMLLAVAGMLGCAAHAAVAPSSLTPLIGASGAISGIICFYSLLHPHARIGLFVRYYFRGEWLQVSARTAFVLWMAIQFFGVYLQREGQSEVSALAHLGGVLAGIGAWMIWRDQ